MKYRFTWRNIRQRLASEYNGDNDWDIITDEGWKCTLKEFRLWKEVRLIEIGNEWMRNKRKQNV